MALCSALCFFLQLSEAKATLSQQAQMLQELSEWEETNIGRELLQNGVVPLSGCRVSVCNVQQPVSWINGVITSHNLQSKVHITCVLNSHQISKSCYLLHSKLHVTKNKILKGGSSFSHVKIHGYVSSIKH
jgi:hypothetical protein